MNKSPDAAAPREFNWRYTGRAWCVGDGIGVDGDLMALEFAIKRETRPEVLAAHVFESIDPGFADRSAPGDVVVAGKRFAHGNPHIQGLLGLRGLGLGLLAESIPSGSYRNCVNAGLPFLAPCKEITRHFKNGDGIAVDFHLGRVDNLTSGWTAFFDPLPSELKAIIAAGGWKASFAARLEKMNRDGSVGDA